MTKEEVVEFVGEVINHVESTTPSEELVRARVKMATWLWTRYKIAVQELVVSAVDGMPYIKVEFTNDEGEKESAHVSLEKHKEKIAKELAGNFDAKDK